MRYYKYSAIWPVPVIMAAWGILLLTACTKNYKDYNTNPNGLTDSMLQLDHVGLGAFLPQIEKSIIMAAPNTGDAAAYQVAQNLNADLYSGYMGTPTPFGGGQNNSNYKLNNGWNNAPFNVGFGTVMPAWYQVKIRAEQTVPDFYAVANILKVEAMHRLTDIYGPIPYTRFGAGGFSVPYDAQEVVYKTFFNELDAAVNTLSAYVQQHPGAAPFRNYDLVYGGDYKEWIRFANALKLRLAMRIVYANAALAKQKAEEAVNGQYGVFSTNNDNALLHTANNVIIHHPLYVIDFNYGDIRAGAVLESFLKGYKDPRISAYMLPAPSWQGAYKGIRNGIDIINKADRQGFSDLNIQDNTPVQWMTAAEVYFLRAEGALRGWNMGGTSQALYEKGIQTSFEQRGVGSAANYINDATTTAAPYVDPVNNANNVPAGSPDLSTITIAWNNADNFEAKLERIITQKWIAMFPDGEEAWAEFRRTGYPKIFPVVVNYSGGTIDTKIQIRRLPFPQSEYQTNAEQVQQAISLLGGADVGGTRLWWDKK